MGSTAIGGHYGLFTFFICSSFAIIPSLVDVGLNLNAFLLVIWPIGGGLRWCCGDRQVATDCFILGIISAWSVKGKLIEVLLEAWKELGAVAGSSPLNLACGAVTTLALLGLSSWRAYSNSKNDSQQLPPGMRKWSLDYPKAKIFPCQTMHARMFPKRHAFQYSYLQCGFPIVPDGTTSHGVDVGLGNDRQLGNWWLRVKADDYLERGNGLLGFYGKLQMYLRQHHVKDLDWSYAYLVTAPRFFGYSFNPVSFWYIYSQDHQLKKMILEVNNTFGERRMYLLDGSSSSSLPRTSGSPIPENSESPFDGSKLRFTDLWMKDFHVSPFNSRKGSYSLKAKDPFSCAPLDTPGIDNTITLKSSKDYAKVVARLYSTGTAIDPAQLGVSGTLRFILSWWWVGLVTFPRILKEATKLYFKKGLQVWFRPEVLPSSIGRSPTSIEISIQNFFHDYLSHLVHVKDDIFNITLCTSIPDKPQRVIATAYQNGREGLERKLEIRVLTPAFYSRFVHYVYASEAFDRECIFTDEKNRTLWVSRPELLPLLLSQPSTSGSECVPIPPMKRGYLDELRWTLLRKLRCPPAEPVYPEALKASNFTIKDIRTLPFSELDVFVRSSHGRLIAGEYRRAVTKLFLAQRFTLGFTEVVSMIDLVLRVLSCYLAASVISTCGTESGSWSDGGYARNVNQEAYLGWWWLPEILFSVSACHVYGFFKGYR